MHDLSGLGIPVIVTFGGLPGAEHIQRSAGEVGINQRVLQRDDQAVAAEKGDEPRHARRRHELQEWTWVPSIGRRREAMSRIACRLRR